MSISIFCVFVIVQFASPDHELDVLAMIYSRCIKGTIRDCISDSFAHNINTIMGTASEIKSHSN